MLILRAQPRKPLTKTISAKVNADGTTEYQIGQYNQKILQFSGREAKITDFESLAATLDELATDPYSCVVRGALQHGVDPSGFYRRKTSNPKGGCIEDVDRQWVCLDIDGVPLSALQTDLRGAPDAVRQLLPSCFAKAACWWNFSASQGFKPGNSVSLHMWFWLDEEISNGELKRYFTLFNESFNELYGIERFVDTVLFDQIQIHYTAPPDLIDVEDPLSKRHGTLDGEPVVRIREDWIKAPSADEGGPTKHLSRLGDDNDGFHSPLLSASAAWVRVYGASSKVFDEFKALARDMIARADRSRHTDEQMERYASDQFLDQLLRSAAQKGFDSREPILDIDSRKFFQEYVYCEGPGKFYKKSSGMYVGLQAFEQVARKVLKQAGGAKTFIDSDGEIADYAISIPGEEPLTCIKWRGRPVFNKWRGRQAVKLEEYDVTPWEDHLDFLCDYRPEISESLKDYLAFIIANPGQKVNWCPILGSLKGGTGKSMIKLALRQIYDQDSTSEIGSQDIRSQFNPFMESELVFVEEVYGPDNRAMVNELKAKMTESVVNINIKGIPQYQAPNFANFIMFTNHAVPFPMDAGDRRFMMIYSYADPKPQDYYDGMVAWLKKSGDAIYSWAMDRDLSKFNPGQAPAVTAEKQEIIESSHGMLEATLMNGARSQEWPFQHPVCLMSELVMRLDNILKWDLTPAKLGITLKALNIRTISGQVKRGGKLKKFTVVVTEDPEKYQAMGPAQLYDEASKNVIGERADYYEYSNM